MKVPNNRGITCEKGGEGSRKGGREGEGEGEGGEEREGEGRKGKEVGRGRGGRRGR